MRMTYNLSKLSATMLANHITVRFPIDDATLERCKAADDDEREYALAAERLPVRFQQSWLRSALAQVGYRQFFDHLQFDPSEGWCIHIFFADWNAIPVARNITDGTVGPGSLRGLNAEEFVRDRLGRLQEADRLTTGYAWWDEDFTTEVVGNTVQAAPIVV
jgi:hypothetical protein